MQTKVIYLSGNILDEETLAHQAAKGFKLQSVVPYQGQIVGYLVREPWAAPQPLEAPKPFETKLDTYVDAPVKNENNNSRKSKRN